MLYDVVLHPEWRPGPDQELRVFDLGWLSPAAHRALVQYLAAYDLARTVSLTILPVDDPLFYQAQEPRSLQIHVEDGTLVRIVDLGAALEGRGYDTEGRLCFSLGDDLCPWNSGVWNLSVEEGVARLQPSGAEPELVLTPRALAILASGHLGATTLARQGLIPPAAAAVLSTADALFRTAHAPLCTNDF